MKRFISLSLLFLISISAIASDQDISNRVAKVSASFTAPEIMKYSTMTKKQQKLIFNALKDKLIQISGTNEVVQIKTPHLSASGLTLQYSGIKPQNDDLIYIASSVVQSIGGNKYLLEDHSGMIEMTDGKTYVDNDNIRCFAKDSGVFNYTSVMGTQQRVRSYRSVPTESADMDCFSKSLESGRHFLILLPVEHKCPECKGRKVIKASKKDRPCARCGGTGTIAYDICRKIVW